MTVDLLLRILGVVVAPLVTVLIFITQEGRRQMRLAKQAKTAGELLNLATDDSQMRRELATHFEETAKRYLDRERRQRNWFELRAALVSGTFTVWVALLWWWATNPADQPAWIRSWFGENQSANATPHRAPPRPPRQPAFPQLALTRAFP